MGAVVRNLYLVNGRWKYRKVISARLREHIDGGITEFVRWLGPAQGLRPTPEILRKLAAVEAECSLLVAVAEKRASGRFDELGAEAVAHIVAQARSDLLEEDEEARFDPSEDALYQAVREQLQGAGMAVPKAVPDRRWNNRQESLEGALDFWRHEYARGQLSDFVVDEVRDRCAAQGLHVDPQSLGFRRLGKAYLALLIEVAEAGLKRQRGELVPTPEPPAPKDAEQLRGVPDQTITGLVADWWKEAKRAGRTVSTYEAYERVARQFVTFLDHDDANVVSQEDVIRFKDHRLEQGASPKTVKDSDLSGLRALFGWGLANRRVKGNPAHGVSVVVPRRAQTRPNGFTDEEAEALLSHALHHRQSPREGAKLAAAKQWVPWLCAYTGARVGEMVQLRKQDLFEKAGRWVVAITSEAVAVKGGEYREVPLHLHLVELGFPDFAKVSGEGFLFLNPSGPSEEAKRGAWRTVKNRVREFARLVITDPRVQPNHAWRHRMETLARDYEFRQDTTNFITGHRTPGVAASYGDTTIKAMARALDRLPRYEVG